MRISDWSSDVCSSDLAADGVDLDEAEAGERRVELALQPSGAVPGGLAVAQQIDDRGHDRRLAQAAPPRKALSRTPEFRYVRDLRTRRTAWPGERFSTVFGATWRSWRRPASHGSHSTAGARDRKRDGEGKSE